MAQACLELTSYCKTLDVALNTTPHLTDGIFLRSILSRDRISRAQKAGTNTTPSPVYSDVTEILRPAFIGKMAACAPPLGPPTSDPKTLYGLTRYNFYLRTAYNRILLMSLLRITQLYIVAKQYRVARGTFSVSEGPVTSGGDGIGRPSLREWVGRRVSSETYVWVVGHYVSTC